MKIEFTQNRTLANRKEVKAGEVYDIEELNINEDEAQAYIENDVAEESI